MLSFANDPWEDAHSTLEPQITSESVHLFPFRPEFPIDVRFLRFTPSSDVRMNRHEYFEIVFVVSGTVTYQVHEQLYEVRPGDALVVGSTHLHGIKRYETPGLQSVALFFLPELLVGQDAGAREHVEYLMPFRTNGGILPHLIAAKTGIPAQILDLIRRTHGELPGTTTRARLSIRTYLRMMLVLLVNHYVDWRGGDEIFEQQTLKHLSPLFDYLDGHYGEVISLEDAAAMVNMSKSHFTRSFRELTGQSFVTYLNRFRIAKAETLLAEPGLSMLEVSQRVGFCDQSYFGLVFRNMLQMTPREYKQRLHENRMIKGFSPPALISGAAPSPRRRRAS